MSNNGKGITERQERFCQMVFAGKEHLQAFIECGYCPGSSRETQNRQAKRLMHYPSVVARLAQLRERATIANVMTVEERKLRLSEHGRASLADWILPDGSIRIPKRDDANVRAILKYRVINRYDKDGDVLSVTREIELADPVPSIKTLNDIEGVGRGDGSTVNLLEMHFHIGKGYEEGRVALPPG